MSENVTKYVAKDALNNGINFGEGKNGIEFISGPVQGIHQVDMHKEEGKEDVLTFKRTLKYEDGFLKTCNYEGVTENDVTSFEIADGCTISVKELNKQTIPTSYDVILDRQESTSGEVTYAVCSVHNCHVVNNMMSLKSLNEINGLADGKFYFVKDGEFVNNKKIDPVVVPVLNSEKELDVAFLPEIPDAMIKEVETLSECSLSTLSTSETVIYVKDKQEAYILKQGHEKGCTSSWVPLTSLRLYNGGIDKYVAFDENGGLNVAYTRSSNIGSEVVNYCALNEEDGFVITEGNSSSVLRSYNVVLNSFDCVYHYNNQYEIKTFTPISTYNSLETPCSCQVYYVRDCEYCAVSPVLVPTLNDNQKIDDTFIVHPVVSEAFVTTIPSLAENCLYDIRDNDTIVYAEDTKTVSILKKDGTHDKVDDWVSIKSYELYKGDETRTLSYADNGYLLSQIYDDCKRNEITKYVFCASGDEIKCSVTLKEPLCSYVPGVYNSFLSYTDSKGYSASLTSINNVVNNISPIFVYEKIKENNSLKNNQFYFIRTGLVEDNSPIIVPILNDKDEVDVELLPGELIYPIGSIDDVVAGRINIAKYSTIVYDNNLEEAFILKANGEKTNFQDWVPLTSHKLYSDERTIALFGSDEKAKMIVDTTKSKVWKKADPGVDFGAVHKVVFSSQDSRFYIATERGLYTTKDVTLANCKQVTGFITVDAEGRQTVHDDKEFTTIIEVGVGEFVTYVASYTYMFFYFNALTGEKKLILNRGAASERYINASDAGWATDPIVFDYEYSYQEDGEEKVDKKQCVVFARGSTWIEVLVRTKSERYAEFIREPVSLGYSQFKGLQYLALFKEKYIFASSHYNYRPGVKNFGVYVIHVNAFNEIIDGIIERSQMTPKPTSGMVIGLEYTRRFMYEYDESASINNRFQCFKPVTGKMLVNGVKSNVLLIPSFLIPANNTPSSPFHTKSGVYMVTESFDYLVPGDDGYVEPASLTTDGTESEEELHALLEATINDTNEIEGEPEQLEVGTWKDVDDNYVIGIRSVIQYESFDSEGQYIGDYWYVIGNVLENGKELVITNDVYTGETKVSFGLFRGVDSTNSYTVPRVELFKNGDEYFSAGDNWKHHFSTTHQLITTPGDDVFYSQMLPGHKFVATLDDVPFNSINLNGRVVEIDDFTAKITGVVESVTINGGDKVYADGNGNVDLSIGAIVGIKINDSTDTHAPTESSDGVVTLPGIVTGIKVNSSTKSNDPNCSGVVTLSGVAETVTVNGCSFASSDGVVDIGAVVKSVVFNGTTYTPSEGSGVVTISSGTGAGTVTSVTMNDVQITPDTNGDVDIGGVVNIVKMGETMYYPQNGVVTLPEVSQGIPTLQTAITVNSPVGGYRTGDVIPVGTSYETILQKIFGV